MRRKDRQVKTIAVTTLTDAIEIRRSRRKYLPTPINPVAVKKIKSLINEYTLNKNFKISFVTDDGAAFNGFRKSYGMLSGVRNYIGLIGNKNDYLAYEKLGYYGELLVLHATTLGLGTCWVGGTFDRAVCPFTLTDNENIICTITVGNVASGLSTREKLIHNLTHRKTKAAEQMYISSGPVPDWFISGMEAVKKAPSAVNRQPVIFCYKNGVVTASVKNISGDGYALDLGIAKLHFEIGSGGGTWEFGNEAAFTKSGVKVDE